MTITRPEAAQLLAIASTEDNRDITDEAITIWSKILGNTPITYADAEAAVVEFLGSPEAATRRVTVSDVVRLGSEIYNTRVSAEWKQAQRIKHAHYPGGITHEDVRQGRAELPEGFPPPPDGSTVRDRREDLIRLIGGLPIRTAENPEPRLVRDDPELLHALQEHFRIDPVDGHERWSLTGDPGMRRRQPPNVSAAARARGEEASRAKARRIVAEHRRETHQELRPQDVEALRQAEPPAAPDAP